MTCTAADVRVEIERIEAKKSTFFASRGWVGSPTGWRPATGDEWRELHGLDDSLEALREELLVAQRVELDAATHPAARNRAMRLRAAYRARADLQVLAPGETWASLPLDEARAWAAVEREAARQ